MLRRLLVAGAAAGVLGGAMVLDAASAANDAPPISDISAQFAPGKGPPPKGAAPRVAPRVAPVAPRVVAPGGAPRVAPGAPRVVNPQFAPRGAPGAPRVVNPQFAPRVAPGAPRVVHPQFAPRPVPVAPRVVSPPFAPRVVPGGVPPRVAAPPPRFVPRISPGARGASFIGGRQIHVNRGAYRRHYGGRVVTFLGVGALAAIVVGGYYYQPYGLVEVEPPACTGITDEGCELRMTEVPTEEGDVVPQCVQFCPQQPE